MKTAFLALAALTLSGCQKAAASQQSPIAPEATIDPINMGEAGIAVWKDPVTGCEYLQRGEFLTPRYEWSNYSRESYRVKGCHE